MSGQTIAIRLVPHGGRGAIVGERDRRDLVRVAAPPVDGRANEALRRLIADRLRVPRGVVTIARGHASRDQYLRVEGMAAADARRCLLGA